MFSRLAHPNEGITSNDTGVYTLIREGTQYEPSQAGELGYRISRLDGSGALDTSFGTDGHLTVDYDPPAGFPFQPDFFDLTGILSSNSGDQFRGSIPPRTATY